MDDMHRDIDEGADFTHTTHASASSAAELFARYLEFKRVIAGLSRKELVARHWLTAEHDDSTLDRLFFDLQFAGQPTLFRRSSDADSNLLAIWHARARSLAEYECLQKPVAAFMGLSSGELRELAQLSVNPAVVRELPSILAGRGIILVYVYALPGMRTDGAVFRLTTGNPVVALSLRFPRLDYFWFTLLHELAHVVLHVEALHTPHFVDVESDDQTDTIERAANRLAKDSIVDRASWRACEPRYDSRPQAVLSYARTQGVHPSLIAGLLRKETGDYKRYSAIIGQHDVRTIIFQP
jgi:HTH-type transcriptional regulator / antitoxin HigA